MKKKAIYPGSFDPLTKGHVDIVTRAISVFDELTIVIASNVRKSGSKSGWFTPEERKTMIKSVFKGEPKVKVDICEGLIMDYARENGVCAVVRGLRANGDFESEFMMAAMNKEIYPKVETLFMITGKGLFFVSSSMLKELAIFGGDISPYVPKQIVGKVLKKVKGM